MLDDRLIEALERGDIRFLRSAWLNQQPDWYQLKWRQELERFDCDGPESPLMSSMEAAALVRKGNRAAGALTHGALMCASIPWHIACALPSRTLPFAGWLSMGDPDPAGQRMQVVRQALAKNPHIEGLFWECASRV